MSREDKLLEALNRCSRYNERINLALELLAREPMLHEIMAQVAIKNAMFVEDVLPPSRFAAVHTIMHEFFYRALTETTASTNLVAAVSARDHTTVLYGAARHAYRNDLPIARGGDGGRYYRQRRGQENGAQEA